MIILHIVIPGTELPLIYYAVSKARLLPKVRALDPKANLGAYNKMSGLFWIMTEGFKERDKQFQEIENHFEVIDSRKY